IAEDFVRAAIAGDDAIEDARLRIGVELNEDFAFLGHDAPPACSDTSPTRKRGSSFPRLRVGLVWNEKGLTDSQANGCLAVSFLAVISSIFGSPFIARWID